jgi:4-amino-4-deoxy-L-arabinose transferase-like glycosyltransferase
MALLIALLLWLSETIRRRVRPTGSAALAFSIMLAIPLLWLVPAVLAAGPGFLHEIAFKQTLGRAVDAWVHREPPWFYLTRLPAEVCPWSLLLVFGVIAAFERRDERAKFLFNWLAAILVPYSLISSKLDVYMLALIPPMAMLIARLLAAEDRWSRWAYRSNLFSLALTVVLGLAGALLCGRYVSMLDPALAASSRVQILFALLAASSLAAFVLALRFRDALSSTLLLALMQFVPLLYTATVLVPVANELASTEPLVRTLSSLNVAPETIALYEAPHLWVRDMPQAFTRVRYAGAAELHTFEPRVIVTSRAHAREIEDVLDRYARIREVRILGKWFDVYSWNAASSSRRP